LGRLLPLVYRVWGSAFSRADAWNEKPRDDVRPI